MSIRHSDSLRKRWTDPAQREILLLGMKKRKNAWSDPAYRARMMKMRSDPEYRETLRKMWKDPAHRAKMILARSTPDHLARASEAQKKRWADPDYRSRVSVALRKTMSDPAYRTLRKQIAGRQWSNPESRDRVATALVNSRRTPQYRAARVIASRKRWMDPDFKAKMAAIYADPAYRNKLSVAIKKVWSDPAMHAKVSGEFSATYGKTPPHPKPIYYHGMILKSSYELAFAKHLEARETKFAYEPERFKFDFGTYVPDFFIYNDDGSLAQIVEIKGWVKPKDITKVSALRELMAPRGVPVTMYTDRHLKEMGAL